MTRLRLIAPSLGLAVLVTAACGGRSPSGPSSTSDSAPASIAGPYRLTIAPSSVCTTWPANPDARLAWDVDITSSGREWTANVPPDAYSFRVSGLGGYPSDRDMYLSTYISAKRGTCWLDVLASGSGTLSGRRVVGTLNGDLEVSCDGARTLRCAAANHAITLDPR